MFRSDIGKKFSAVGVVKHWYRLAREVLTASFLEVLKAWFSGVLSNLSSGKRVCPWQKVGALCSLRSLPTQIRPWLHALHKEFWNSSYLSNLSCYLLQCVIKLMPTIKKVRRSRATEESDCINNPPPNHKDAALDSREEPMHRPFLEPSS